MKRELAEHVDWGARRVKRRFFFKPFRMWTIDAGHYSKYGPGFHFIEQYTSCIDSSPNLYWVDYSIVSKQFAKDHKFVYHRDYMGNVEEDKPNMRIRMIVNRMRGVTKRYP